MMAPYSLKPLMAAVMVASLVAGCSLAPVYERPDAPVASSYGDAAGSDESQDLAASDLGWAEFFNDPRLQAYIELALENNRDLRIAVERVSEAQAAYGISESDRMPTIGAGANAQSTRNPENMRIGGPEGDSVSRTYMAGIGLTAFEIDFFGRLKNLSEAAYERYLAT